MQILETERVHRYIVVNLDTGDSGFEFRAGKYATFTLRSGDRSMSRIFSISSSPLDTGHVRFATIMREGSEFKETLARLVKGDTVEVSSPMGGFLPVSNRKRPLFFITSGIGITPVISILKWASVEDEEREIRLVYINEVPEDRLFYDEIENVRERMSDFSPTSIIVKNFQDRLIDILSTSSLEEYASGMDITRTMFYVSGKPAFVLAARKSLRNSGIQVASIKIENFSGY